MKNFQCFELALEAVRLVRPLIAKIERHDRDLGRQLRRSLTSVPLNLAEGSKSRGRNRPARYADAMGSAEEAMATLQTAEALGYLVVDDLPKPIDKLDHVVSILVKLCR